MEENTYRELFLQTKAYYFSIGKVCCPALDNEFVYFDKRGFEHLMRKGSQYRPEKDQIRRFLLLKHAREILESEPAFEYKSNTIHNSTAHFWNFSKKVHGRVISVVLRKLNNGNIHFFSIMNY